MVKEKSAPQSDVDAVLSCIGSGQSQALLDALNHEVLHQFIPEKLQKKFPARKFPFTKMKIILLSDRDSGVVVEICRHTHIHCKDPNVRKLVLNRLKVASYSREELTEVLRMVYPNFIRDAYTVLVVQGNWAKLKVRERLPIPSIHLAPASALVSFNFVLVFLKE